MFSLLTLSKYVPAVDPIATLSNEPVSLTFKLPVNRCESLAASPNILDPSVSKILEVTIEDVKAVTVRLSTVISVAVREVTAILAARASESTPPSFM